MTEQEATPLSFKEMVNECLIRPLKFVVTEPLLDLVCAFVALIYAYLYAFFFAYPYIFSTLYGFGDDKIGLMFIPILIGAGFAVITTYVLEVEYSKLVKEENQNQKIDYGVPWLELLSHVLHYSF